MNLHRRLCACQLRLRSFAIRLASCAAQRADGRRRVRVGHRSRVRQSARHDPSAVATDPALRAVRHARSLRLGPGARPYRGVAVGVVARPHAPHPASRADLRWHDGRPTTARDVAFTIDAARDPATGYWRAADLASVDSVVARDDSTAVRRAFGRRSRAFPLVFCELPIFPRICSRRSPHAEMRRAAFNFEPVGNGPFAFVERRAGERWVFRRNDTFPADARRTAAVARVRRERRRRADHEVRRTRQRRSRRRRHFTDDGVARARAIRRCASSSIRFSSRRASSSTFTSRRSTTRACDGRSRCRSIESASLRAALAGYGRPAAGPVPPESPLALDGAPGSRHRARGLAARRRRLARGPDGARPRRTVVRVRPPHRRVAATTRSSSSFRPISRSRGIRVEHPASRAGHVLSPRRARSHKTFDVLVAGIPGDVALAFLGAMFESRQSGGALDYTGFHPRELDSLFAATRTAQRPTPTRIAAWRNVPARARRLGAGGVALSLARRAGSVGATPQRDDGSARRDGDAVRLEHRSRDRVARR